MYKRVRLSFFIDLVCFRPNLNVEFTYKRNGVIWWRYISSDLAIVKLLSTKSNLFFLYQIRFSIYAVDTSYQKAKRG